MSRTSRPLITAAALALVLGLGACAERAEDDPTPGDVSGFPVTLEPEGAPAVTIADRPDRIVSLSPTSTETLYAVGAGDQVVAVDEMSSFPDEAPRTTLSGLNLDPEAIASHTPDLVIVDADADGKLAEALAKVDIDTLVLPAPATLEGAYTQFELIGRATGHADEGADLADRTRTEVEKLAADARVDGTTTYYHELDPTFYSVTSTTFIGQVYALFGLENIADQGNPTANGGYPQLSAEKIIAADPDLIFLADAQCCGIDAAAVAARPGWNTLTAVSEGRIIALDEDIASRWSPRIVDLVRAVADALDD